MGFRKMVIKYCTKLINRTNKKMYEVRKNIYLRIPLGILFIILAIIGGFLPVVQGWVFMVIGLTILFGEKFTKLLIKIYKKIKKKFRKRKR